MSIEPISSNLDYPLSNLDYPLNEIEKKEEGSDGKRTYTLLESSEYCTQCCKNFKMLELGVEKVSFQVYQLAGAKFFDMDFNVSVAEGKTVCLRFTNRSASANGMIEFFSDVRNVAATAGAAGLATLSNRAVILVSRGQFPPDKDSQYLRCMEGCDRVEFEPLKLLCYLACTIWGDQTPGS